MPVPSHVVMWVTWLLDTWRSEDINYGDLGDMAKECGESTSVTETWHIDTWHIDTWHIDTWHIDAWNSIGGTYQTRIRGSRSLRIVRKNRTLSTDSRRLARNAYRCRSRTRNVVDLGPRRRIRFARQRGCTGQRVFAVLRDRGIL
jgi:hypothetical protein